MGNTHWARLTRGVEPTRLRRFDVPTFSADAARAVLARLAVAEASADFVPPPPRHATPPPEAVAPAVADSRALHAPDDAPIEVTDADVQQAAPLDEAPIEVDDFEEIVDETFGPSADDPDEAPALAAEASPLVVDDDFEIEEVIEQPPVHFEPIVLADAGGEDADIDFDGFDDDLPGAHGSVAEDLAQFFDDEAGPSAPTDREAEVARLDDSRSGDPNDEADRQQDVRSSVKKLFRRD